MKKVLLVEDDPVVVKLYGESLAQHGFEVTSAADGVAGVAALGVSRPDIVVLDLILPRLSGEEVLKYMRSRDDYRPIPVIVFSNAYLGNLTQEAIALGIDGAVLKSSCSPLKLVDMLDAVLEKRQTAPETPCFLAGEASSNPAESVTAPDAEAKFRAEARRRFIAKCEETVAALSLAHENLVSAEPGPARIEMVKALYRDIHNLTSTAGLADSRAAEQLSMGLEALLFQVQEKPAQFTASVLRTISSSVDELIALLGEAAHERDNIPTSASALVVDDDPIANRVMTAALRNARLEAQGVGDPLVGLQIAQSKKLDLIILDIEMPQMDGLEFCRQLRGIDGYRKVPVIYVTAHSDFETRAKSIFSGGTDLIAKPIFPLELAVKALTQLLKSR